MSCEPAVRLRGISKCFQSYPRPAFRLLQALYGQRRKFYDEFWALRDIDLDIRAGQTVGIVGKNGSGKSTLLQIIAGTLTATAGTVETRGRISAILELGAGFNPQFTGIENARLSASIMGITRGEMEDFLPRIAEFSELGEFVQRPVSTYSSGMYVRLAFSVAINMQPEILIIDEALAVGDLKFQRKCFRKLEELREQGVTILFVTHATDTVINHCDQAMFVDGGRVCAQGKPKAVVNAYLESLFDLTPHHAQTTTLEPAPDSVAPSSPINTDPAVDGCVRRRSYNPAEYRWGNGQARIIDYLLLDPSGNEVFHECQSGERLRVVLVVYFEQSADEVIYGLTIKTVDGTAVYGTNSALLDGPVKARRRGDTAVVSFDVRMDLVGAEYFISLGVVRAAREAVQETVLDRRYDLCQLKLTGNERGFGLAALDGRIEEFDDLGALLNS